MSKVRGAPSGPRGRANVGDARTSILQAADRLFYRHGIGAVGVDALAADAGITKRTLYYHFKSKEDLAAAYLEARDVATLNAVFSEPGDAGVLPGDRILGVFQFVERWASTPEYRGCPFNNVVGEQVDSDPITAIVRRHKATVRRWFAGRAAEGGADEPDQVGAQLLVLLDGALNGAGVFQNAEMVVVARSIVERILDDAGVERTRRRPARRKRK